MNLCYTSAMRRFRIVLGSLILLAIAAGSVAGVWMLYQHAGGGLPVEVVFQDTKGLGPGDRVFYGDQFVGRIERIEPEPPGQLVRVRIAADHARLVREGSRFWIESHIGTNLLRFDRTSDAGPPAQPGARFQGLAERPDPDPELLPPPAARPLRARPVWLCGVRATTTSRITRDEVIDRARKAAGAVVHVSSGGDLLILAPAWVIEPQGEVLGRVIRVEIIGEGVRLASLVHARGDHAILHVSSTEYRQVPAELWPYEIENGQTLVLADSAGAARPTVLEEQELVFRAELMQGHVALIEGLNLAGFAVPKVGAAVGAEWVSLHGAGTVLDEAMAVLND
jgi:hypothetical protein